MNFTFYLRFITKLFSINPKSMRFISLKRIFVVFTLAPLFCFLFVINRIFLLLDYLVFPAFLKQSITNPVFIISAPRSATTFVYQGLASTNEFTCFKLWEIIFAPSICQKYFFNWLFQVDKKLSNPLKKLVLWIEEILIGKLKKIHLIGLNLPEEDEAVMLWSLNTFYFSFFYPDSAIFDDFALFDQKINKIQRERIMSNYKKYIQRHQFVFNRNQQRRFLSKNPMLMPKCASLYQIFPDAQIININRCPGEVIPSTLALNQTLCGFFTSKKMTEEIRSQTKEVLIEWYIHCEAKLNLHFSGQFIKISFLKIINQEQNELFGLANFLHISPEKLWWQKTEMNKKHKSSNNYSKLSDSELEQILNEIPFMTESCRL